MKVSEIKSLWDQADSDEEKAKSYAETSNALRWQVAESIAAKLAEKDENGKRVISQRDLAKELGRSQTSISHYNAVWQKFGGTDCTAISFAACMTKVREEPKKQKPPVNEVRPAPQNEPVDEPQVPTAPLPNGNESFIEPGQEVDPTQRPMSGGMAMDMIGYHVGQAAKVIDDKIAEIAELTSGVTVDDTYRGIFIDMLDSRIESLQMLRAAFEAGAFTDPSDILGS